MNSRLVYRKRRGFLRSILLGVFLFADEFGGFVRKTLVYPIKSVVAGISIVLDYLLALVIDFVIFLSDIVLFLPRQIEIYFLKRRIRKIQIEESVRY